jgi:hypothetical protein
MEVLRMQLMSNWLEGSNTSLLIAHLLRIQTLIKSQTAILGIHHHTYYSSLDDGPIIYGNNTNSSM